MRCPVSVSGVHDDVVPWACRNSAVRRPSPSADPVMRMRLRITLLREQYGCQRPFKLRG